MWRGLQLYVHLPPFTGSGAALAAAFIAVTGKGEARHRANTRQRLAAKAQAAHPLQVFQGGDLAGGVAGQRQRQVVRRHTTAIIAYADQLTAAGLHVDIHPGGAGVEAVFQYFLHHGGRALNHLSGGDLVGQPRAEQVNAGHLVLYHVVGIRSFCPTMIFSPLMPLRILMSDKRTLNRWAMPESVSPLATMYC